MQVERTLVKSPPELWAEVSDVDALTRHLSQFGEIAITRVEPESKVAWEGEHARGTVELTASGWGTKVTLTAEQAMAPVEPTVAVAEPPIDDEDDHHEPGQVTAEVAVVSIDDAAPQPALRARWRWLRFWRREADPEAGLPTLTPGPPVPPTPTPAPEPVPPTPTPSPGPPAPPDPNPPQIKAVLAEALDSLGQAHHRPFSR